MVLSNKKLKQKLRAAKAAVLAQSEAQIQLPNHKSRNSKEPTSTEQESLKSLLDAVAQNRRLSKRERRRKKSLTLQENDDNLIRDDGHGNEGNGEDKKEKKKRKRDDENGLETEEVKKVPEKEKKKKRKRDDEKGLESEEGKEVPEKKKKKKRKGDDENGLEAEVKKVTEKKKKKKKKVKKKKNKGKNKVQNAEEVNENLESGNAGSKKESAAELDYSLEACTKVYVGGIPYYSSEDDIRSYFEGCGTITEIGCMTFPESGKFRGIAIITFKTEAAAKRALALDGSDMGGLFLKIQPYKSNKVTKSASFSPAIVEGYNRIYVGNLSWEITEDELRNLFAGCNIASIRFGEDKETGEFRGYAHVDFSDSVSLNAALKHDQKIVCGRPVRISCAVPRKGLLSKTRTPENEEAVNKTAHQQEKNAADGDAAVSGKIRRRTCYECGECGHLSSSCPKKRAAEQTNAIEHQQELNAVDETAEQTIVSEHQEEKGAADGDAVAAVSGKIRRRTCYECGERGHLSSSCPKKQAAEQTNAIEHQQEENAVDETAEQTIVSEHQEEKAAADGDAVAAISGKIRRRTCYECGERGHLSSSCPKKQAAAQTNAIEHQEENAAEKTIVSEHQEEKDAANGDGVAAVSGKIRRRTCYECGERGHLSSSCPKKQAVEQTNLATS